MGESFEVVFKSSQVHEVEMYAEVLVRNGIDARIIGTQHAAMMAAAQHIAPVRIEVPASRAAEARALIEALQSEPTGEDVPEGEPPAKP
jgi:hypothetical protein